MLKRIRNNLPILALTLSHGTVDFYPALLPALTPALASYLSIPIGDVVTLVGIVGLINNAVQPLVGHVMNKRNLGYVMWFGMLLSVLPAFMGFATGYVSLFLLAIVGALGTGIFHPEGLLSAHDVSQGKTYVNIPLFMAGGSCLNAIAALIAIQWVKWFGFPAMSLLAIPGVIMAAAMFKQYSRKKKAHPSVVRRPRAKSAIDQEESKFMFWPLMASTTCFGIGTGLFFSMLTTHYELIFGPDSLIWAGAIMTIVGIGAAGASFLWGYLAKKHGFYRTILFTQIVAIPLYFLLIFPGSPQIGLLVSLPLSIFNSGAVFPVAVVLVRGAKGLNPSLRAGMLIGGTWGTSAIIVMLAGVLLRHGVTSSAIMSITAWSSLVAVAIAVWQLRIDGTLSRKRA